MDFNWKIRHEPAGFICGIHLAATEPLALLADNL